MALSPYPGPYPAQLEFHNDYKVARWRPLVAWLLVVPHLIIVWALNYLRAALTLVSFFTVLFTEQIPRPVFDAIAMVYRYEWRAVSYALFLHEDYPPFDFDLEASDDGLEPHTRLWITYPESLRRWAPLYKWFLAIPQYLVLFVLRVAATVSVVAGAVAVIVTGEYPHGIRRFLIDVYRYSLRVSAYTGLLTDRYPPFSMEA